MLKTACFISVYIVELFKKKHICGHYTLKSIVKMQAAICALKMQIDNKFWKPLADQFLFDFHEKKPIKAWFLYVSFMAKEMCCVVFARQKERINVI
jgi:hypothetical protein